MLFKRVIDVRVRADDDAGVAAQFEHDFLLRRACFYPPTYHRTSREADELNSFICNKLLYLASHTGYDIDCCPEGSPV